MQALVLKSRYGMPPVFCGDIFLQSVADGDGFEDEKDAYLMKIFYAWKILIREENKTLKDVLPKNYVSLYFEQRVVDVFMNMDMTDIENSKDLLGTSGT